MEAKKFISTLKGIRTRYSKNPNVEAEKKAVMTLVEKFGGKLETIATLNEQGQSELKDYVKSVMGVVTVEQRTGRVVKEEDGKEYAVSGVKLYELDNVKHTLKRVYKDLKDIKVDDIPFEPMPMTVYQRYLKDHFVGEDAPIKKGKLYFRGYRISYNAQDGFLIEDTTKRYEAVETNFEGIPTPKELGDFFSTPVVEHTPEELKAAVERGKEISRKRKEESEKKDEPAEEVDFEALRDRVLNKIRLAQSKSVDVDPAEFIDMIPFKRWKRKAKSLLKQWQNKEIRYQKFLKLLTEATIEETFVVEEKRHRSSFKGTLCPAFSEVGLVKGDRIEVDGKEIPAVPFLVEYLLWKEPRAMSQLMKFGEGMLDMTELLKNPLEVDWKVDYNSRSVKNTAENTAIVCMLYEVLGITAPQDMCYGSGLSEGDKILIILDGELKYKKVTSVDKGVFLGKSTGYLLKSDKWIRI